MKANFRSLISMAALGIAFALAQPWAAPGQVSSMQVPPSYVWDGRQFVGAVGNQFYYLGPGNVWIPMDRTRMNNFRAWERANPHWRSWATPNVRYRTRRPPRPQPIVVQPQPIVVNPPPGTRSGGRPSRPSRSRAHSSTSLDTIPRLKQSPGRPSKW